MANNFTDGSGGNPAVMAATDRTSTTSMPASNSGDELEIPLPVLMGSVAAGTMWKADVNGNPIAATAGTDYVVPGGALGTPASGVLTNCTGTAAGLTAGHVTTNANLAGPITSSGNTTSVAAQTGSGSTFVMQASPALTTPNIGVATATSVNGLSITTGTGTLTIASGKTLTVSNSLTLAGTDSSTLNIGTGGTLGTAAYGTLGTSANYVVQLTAAAKLPAVDGSLLTNLASTQVSGLGTAAAQNVGTSAGQVVQLLTGGKLPVVDGSNLTNLTLSGNVTQFTNNANYTTLAAVAGVGYLTSASSVTSSQVAGTTTNDNAGAGIVGEYITASLAVGSAVSLVTGIAKTVTSISLTAGDWDVTGVVDFHPGTLTTGSYFQGGVSVSTNALGNQDQFAGAPMALAAGLGIDVSLVAPVVRISLATTTTIYLTCVAGFATSTMSAYGTIRARRAR